MAAGWGKVAWLRSDSIKSQHGEMDEVPPASALSKSAGGMGDAGGTPPPTQAVDGAGTTIRGLAPGCPVSVSSRGTAALLKVLALTAPGATVTGSVVVVQEEFRGEVRPRGDATDGVVTTPSAAAAASASAVAGAAATPVAGHAVMLPSANGETKAKLP
jgi:hypothetical protein